MEPNEHTTDGFMGAATKNKRGRPRIYPEELETIFPGKDKRAAQNLYFVAVAIDLLKQERGSFFVKANGNFQRQGVAEQIGRMREQDGYSEEDCKEIAKTAMSLYGKGWSVKRIERWIRTGRKTNEW